MAADRSSLGGEVIFGLIGPIGTDLDRLSKALFEALIAVNYQTQVIHVIEQLHGYDRWKDLPETPMFKRYSSHMDAGNEFREQLGRGDALAMLSLAAVESYRVEKIGKRDQPVPRTAYILRSLKHPDEVRTLRRVYSDAFIAVSAYLPRDQRVFTLADKIAASLYDEAERQQTTAQAEALIVRDDLEPHEQLGQHIRETFPLADVFVDVTEPSEMKATMKRLVEILFWYPYHTPTRDEYGMFHAKAAALRSSDLSRQVGAAICTSDGDVVSVGTNEVPKGGGGLYWPGDKPDRRDFVLERDSARELRKGLLGEILRKLHEEGWLATDKKRLDLEQLNARRA